MERKPITQCGGGWHVHHPFSIPPISHPPLSFIPSFSHKFLFFYSSFPLFSGRLFLAFASDASAATALFIASDWVGFLHSLGTCAETTSLAGEEDIRRNYPSRQRTPETTRRSILYHEQLGKQPRMFTYYKLSLHNSNTVCFLLLMATLLTASSEVITLNDSNEKRLIDKANIFKRPFHYFCV